MSTNCISCAIEKRTGIDLLCDACRAERAMSRIATDNAADRWAMETWWRTSTNTDRFRVWCAIQRNYPDDPVMEIISRFAQVAFGECVEKLGLDTTGGDRPH